MTFSQYTVTASSVAPTAEQNSRIWQSIKMCPSLYPCQLKPTQWHTLKNSWDHWVDEAKDTTVPGSAERIIAAGNYTNKRWTADQQASTKYGGWDTEGIDFYNEAQDYVFENRKKRMHGELEGVYKDLVMKRFETKGRAPRAKPADTGKRAIVYPSDIDEEDMEEEDNEDECDPGIGNDYDSDEDNCVE